MSIQTSRDPTQYLKRKGLAATDDLPSPRYQSGVNPVHGTPLVRPRPDADVLLPARRPASPDSGGISEWPER